MSSGTLVNLLRVEAAYLRARLDLPEAERKVAASKMFFSDPEACPVARAHRLLNEAEAQWRAWGCPVDGVPTREPATTSRRLGAAA